jgi:hypothetical protein
VPHVVEQKPGLDEAGLVREGSLFIQHAFRRFSLFQTEQRVPGLRRHLGF